MNLLTSITAPAQPSLGHADLPSKPWPSLAGAGQQWKWTAMAWPTVLAVALGSFASGLEPLRVVLLLLALPVVEEMVSRLGAQEKAHQSQWAEFSTLGLPFVLACGLQASLGGWGWMFIKAPLALLLGLLYAQARGPSGQLKTKAWVQAVAANALFNALWLVACMACAHGLGITLTMPL